MKRSESQCDLHSKEFDLLFVEAALFLQLEVFHELTTVTQWHYKVKALVSLEHVLSSDYIWAWWVSFYRHHGFHLAEE